MKRNKHASTLYNKELKRLFAKVALGNEHTDNLAFYSNVHEKSIDKPYTCEQHTDNNPMDTNGRQDTAQQLAILFDGTRAHAVYTCQQSQFLSDWQHQQVNRTAHPLFQAALGS